MISTGGRLGAVTGPERDVQLYVGRLAHRYRQAAAFMRIALAYGQCAEVLNVLSDGGAVTFDPVTGSLALATAGMLRQLGGTEEEEPSVTLDGDPISPHEADILVSYDFRRTLDDDPDVPGLYDDLEDEISGERDS